MLRLVREHEVAAEFAVAARDQERCRIAVAFWGIGGASKLGLKRGSDVFVVCNLEHIGCNPDEIAELLRLGIKVRTHRKLHGKVYATSRMCIVGSSNASSNGLTVEGDEAIGWKEANVLSDDPGLVDQANAFFEEIWLDPAACDVDHSMLAEARQRRRSIPSGILNPPRAKTLIAACRERPDAFDHVVVIAYSEPLDISARKELDALKEQAATSDESADRPNFKNAWGYQIGKIPIGTWIIDLDCRRAESPKIWGCSQSVGVEIQIDGAATLTVTPRGVVSVGSRRFPISVSEKAFLEAASQEILAAGEERLLPLAEAIALADKVAQTQIS